MGLQWTSFHRCLQPTFIIKVDDDTVVDYFQLFDFLLEKKYARLLMGMDGHFLAGRVWTGMRVVRQRESKWFVSEDVIPSDTYRPYLSGSLYVTVPQTGRSIVLAALDSSTSIFWIDDVWLTGILREKGDIPLDDCLSELFSFSSKILNCCINDMIKHKIKCPFIVFPHDNHDMMRRYMETLNRQCLLGSSDIQKNICIERGNNQTLKETCNDRNK